MWCRWTKSELFTRLSTCENDTTSTDSCRPAVTISVTVACWKENVATDSCLCCRHCLPSERRVFSASDGLWKPTSACHPILVAFPWPWLYRLANKTGHMLHELLHGLHANSSGIGRTAWRRKRGENQNFLLEVNISRGTDRRLGKGAFWGTRQQFFFFFSCFSNFFFHFFYLSLSLSHFYLLK